MALSGLSVHTQTLWDMRHGLAAHLEPAGGPIWIVPSSHVLPGDETCRRSGAGDDREYRSRDSMRVDRRGDAVDARPRTPA